MTKLTEQQIEQLVAWREGGKSLKWIGTRLGVSSGAVYYQALKHGAIAPRQIGRAENPGPATFARKDGRVGRRFTAEEDARLQALALAGKGGCAIAAALDRPETSVRMRLLMLAHNAEIAIARTEVPA